MKAVAVQLPPHAPRRARGSGAAPRIAQHVRTNPAADVQAAADVRPVAEVHAAVEDAAAEGPAESSGWEYDRAASDSDSEDSESEFRRRGRCCAGA
eukprot:365817-Chlamydomonas_euryale.AAC.10